MSCLTDSGQPSITGKRGPTQPSGTKPAKAGGTGTAASERTKAACEEANQQIKIFVVAAWESQPNEQLKDAEYEIDQGGAKQGGSTNPMSPTEHTVKKGEALTLTVKKVDDVDWKGQPRVKELGPPAVREGELTVRLPDATCKIKKLKLKCGKREEKNGKLCIVFKADLTQSIDVGKLLGLGKEGSSGPKGASVTRKYAGHGKSVELVEVETEGEFCAEAPNHAVWGYGSRPKEWKECEAEKTEVKMYTQKRSSGWRPPLWCLGIKPETFTLTVRGCNESHLQKRQVLVYPSDQHELKLAIHSWAKSKLGGKFVDYLNKWGKGKFGPFTFKAKWEQPSGEMYLKWGWKEASDWRAEYYLELQGAIKKLFAGSVELKLNFAEIAASAGLVSLGFPPPLAQYLVDEFLDYHGELSVFAKFAVQFDLSANGRMSFYSHHGTQGSAAYPMGITFGGSVKLAVGIVARIGSKCWASASVTGQVVVPLKVNSKGTLNIKLGPGAPGPSLDFETDGKLPGVSCSVTFETSCWIWSYKQAKTWTLQKWDITLWKYKTSTKRIPTEHE